MTKNDIVAAIAEKTGLSKKDTDAVVGETFAQITAALAKGEKVQLIGFGSFEVRERAERAGRNPKTKEAITIPASKSPVFKAGKALKDSVQ